MTTRKNTTKKKKVSKKKAVSKKLALKDKVIKKKDVKDEPIKKRTAKKRAVKKDPEKEKSAGKGVAKDISNKTLVLDPVLVINNAKSLSLELNQFVESNADISIDASAVEMIDTAILQLLLAVTTKVRLSKHEVNWVNPSDMFISSASLLGLSKLLRVS